MPRESDPLFRAEDDLPNVQPSPLRPLPPDLVESLATVTPPPPGPDTEQDPPLLTAAQGREILERLGAVLSATEHLAAKVEHVRTEGVDRDRALCNLLMRQHSEMRDELNTKLEGQALRFKGDLDALQELMLGAVEGTRLEVIEQGNRVMYKLDRGTDDRLTAIEGAVQGLATQVADQKRVADEHWPVIEKLAKHAYNLSAAEASAADDNHADVADRPTYAEAPRR